MTVSGGIYSGRSSINERGGVTRVVLEREHLDDRDTAAGPWWQYARGGALVSIAGIALTPTFPSLGMYIAAVGVSTGLICLLPVLPRVELVKIQLERLRKKRETQDVEDRHTTPCMASSDDVGYLSGLEEEVNDFAA